ncbi:MAG TPA: dienelactone hydrolase family protein [Polyangiaceae bacterium]|nr:dienelactone hydrolase family protein [Polyangiaceae bacterium]
MNEIQRYLAEEIAIDCSKGHISRPEAMRRLKVMGLSAAVVAALLSACGGESDAPATSSPAEMNAMTPDVPASGMTTPDPASPPSGTASPDTNAPPAMDMPASSNEGNVTPVAPPDMVAPTTPTPAPDANPTPPSGTEMAVPTEEITFAGPNGVVLQGAWASAAAPRGAVLVIHENRGLNDHIRSVAGRFAAAGYSAIALDLLSEEGGTASLGDVANATAALGNADPARFVADMRAALDELERRVPGAAIGAIGFCFGGGMMWRLVASGDERLAAVAPFYGPLPQGADFSGSNAAVLGVYGELDTRVNATRDAADTALTTAGLEHEMVTFPGANHAFFNDTGMNYNAAAAAEAWTRVLAWFDEHLAAP